MSFSLTSLQKTQAEVAWACGVTRKELADVWGCSYTSLGRYLNPQYAARSREYCRVRAANNRERKIHYDMLRRCYDSSHKSFHDYGGRGIQVCERWKASFESFLADLGPRPTPQHSVDRIDNNGNYEPGNCRWATASIQTSNRRNNIIVEFQGISMTLAEASRRSGIAKETLRCRYLNAPVERLFEPVRRPNLSSN
jgi:hypothetical protein